LTKLDKLSYKLIYNVDLSTYSGFLTTFKDCHPIHTEDTFAQKKGFPQKIMHGNILCGFLSNFVGEQFEINNVVIASQKISFNQPFFLNDELLLEVFEVKQVESVNAINLKFRFSHTHSSKKIASGQLLLKII